MKHHHKWHANAIMLFLFLVLLFGTTKSISQCTISGDDSVCKGSLGVYSSSTSFAGDTSFLWYTSGGGSISGPYDLSTVSIFWSQSGDWTVFCEVFQNDIFVEMCSYEVHVDQILSKLTVTGGDDLQGEGVGKKLTYCIGDEVFVSVTSQADQIEFVWDLDGADVNSIVTSEGIEISFIEAGSVEVCATITNESDCQEILCLEFEIVDPAGVAFEPVPNSENADTLFICKGQTYHFNNLSIPIFGFGYKWTVENGSNTWTYFTGSDELIYPFDSSGVYTISLYRGFESPACDYEPAQLVVIVDENMITPILCPSPVCSGEEICYQSGLDCSKYLWINSEEGTSSDDSTTNEYCVTWNNLPGNTYGSLSLSVNDCTDDYCANPTVVYIPLFSDSVMISGPDMICSQTDSNYMVPYWPGVDYHWNYQIIDSISGTITGSSTSNAIFLTFNNFSGSFLLSVQGQENMGSCSFESSKLIRVYNTRIEVESPVCFATDIDVSLEPASTDSIDWHVYDEFNNEVYQELMGSSTITIPSSVGLAPGLYTITAMMPGGFPGACMIFSTFTVNAPVNPPVISGPPVACLDATYIYQSSLNGEYEWIITGGDDLTGSSTRKVTVMWTEATGPYILRAKRKQGNCWSDYAIKEVMVEDPNDLMIMGNEEPCPDNSEPEIYNISFPGATNVSWEILNPNSHLGSIILGDSPDSIGIFWHFANISNIQLKVTATICGIVKMDTLEIDLTPYEPTYEWPDTICQYSPAEFDVPEAESYQWYIDGIQLVSDTNQVLEHVFPEYGVFHITAIISDPGKCSGQFAIMDSIVVLPSPVASIFLQDPLPCPEGTPFDSIYLETFEYPGFQDVTYKWVYDGNQIGTDPTVMISDTGLYSLSVAIGGCSARGNINVQYNCDPACSCSPEVEVYIDTLYLHNGCGQFVVDGIINPFSDSQIVAKRFIFPAPIGVINITDPGGLHQENSYDEPGIYHIKLEAQWLCENDTICKVSDIGALRIPVISDFTYDFTCMDDGENYLVTVYDGSRSIDTLDENEWNSPNGVQTDINFIQFEASAGDEVEVCLTETTILGYTCTFCDTIFIPLKPEIDFDISAPGFCLNTEVQMLPELTPEGDFISVLWDFGDSSISHINSPIKKYSEIGDYIINLIGITKYGCNIEAVDTFSVDTSSLDGEINISQDVCGSSAELSFLLSEGGPISIYTWSTGETDSIIIVDESGSYQLTVTDENGCTFEVTSDDIIVCAPFPTGIEGNLTSCNTINLKVRSGCGYDYDWIISGPGGYVDTLISSYSLIRTNLSPGLYSVSVTSYDTSGVCTVMSVEVEILGNPTPPTIDLEIINCMPTQAMLSADTIVTWTTTPQFLLNVTAIEISVTGLEGRVITATKTDENGCKSTATETIPRAIDFSSIGTGCGDACPDSVLAHAICLNGIPGTFDHWEWRLEGTAISGESGSNSPIECLLIDTSYLNKYITLVIENDECVEESPLFFIKKIQCPSNCPDSLNLNWMVGLDGISCVSPSLGGEKVLYLDVFLFIPEGYRYCDSEPIFEDGYFEADDLDFDNSNNTLHMAGEYHIDDISGFDVDNIIRGTIDLCSEADTTQSCPASFEIAKIDCHNTCAADPCADGVECIASIELLSVSQHIGQFLLCVELPDEPAGDCDYEDYWIYVYDDDNVSVATEQVDEGDIDDREYCFEFEYPMETMEPCFYIVIRNECFVEEYCDATICVGDTPFSGDDEIEVRSNQSISPEYELIPNPTNGEQLKLKCSNKNSKSIEITLLDTKGRDLIRNHVELHNNEGNINIHGIAPGYYIIQINSVDSKPTTELLPFIIIK